MTTRECPNGCDAEPPLGVILCNGCRRKLEGYLADCEYLREQLTITLTRQDALGPATEGHSKKVDQPGGDQWLKARPYNVNASEVLDALKATLVSWVLLVADETGADTPVDKIAALASWLAVRIDYLVRHEAAADLFDEMRTITRRATATIDLPRDRARIHVGPCPEYEPDGMPCDGEIFAYFPTDQNLRPAMMCVHRGCSHGEMIWPAEKWARLGARIMERMGVSATWDSDAVRRMSEAIA